MGRGQTQAGGLKLWAPVTYTWGQRGRLRTHACTCMHIHTPPTPHCPKHPPPTPRLPYPFWHKIYLVFNLQVHLLSVTSYTFEKYNRFHVVARSYILQTTVWGSKLDSLFCLIVVVGDWEVTTLFIDVVWSEFLQFIHTAGVPLGKFIVIWKDSSETKFQIILQRKLQIMWLVRCL